jgi:hypothetical protein
MDFQTVTLTDLKKDANRLFADVSREHPLRVLHRAHEIKVVIPLDQYLDLMTYWNSGVKDGAVDRTPLAEQLQRVQREFAELNKMLEKEPADENEGAGFGKVAVSQQGR